ncbi:MAG: riboflavin synthase [Bacteroidetes bacterium]|nr:riboflavin synthase [Bacteroidota bacterium]
MFTGIIETTGKVIKISSNGTNKTFWVASPISGHLKEDQSLSHNGVCLTVEKLEGDTHQVTAIEETLKKSNLGNWKEGDLINLERCLLVNGRIDGHIVQGHVDATAICTKIEQREGSWEFSFEFPKKFSHLVIEKGSIALNGISLTIFNVKKKALSVAIIPYTFEHTNIKALQIGDLVNIEFDMVGKYIARMGKSKG